MSELAGVGGDDVARRDADADAAGEIHRPQWQQDPMIVVAQSSAHSGPMPSPQTLAEYDQVVPGLAREIVDMAKAEQTHRHSMEDLVVRGDRDATSRGQKFGLAALVLMLLIAGYMVFEGAAEAAAWLLSTTVVGVVGVFVTGRVVEQRASQKTAEGDEQDPSEH